MTLKTQVVKEGDWGVKVFEGDTPLFLLDADTAIRLGLQMLLCGQDAIASKALEMACLDRNLPQDTFMDMWKQIQMYVAILNTEQKDIGNDPSD